MPRPVVGQESANAKINLALHVLGRERDGFHQLDSLVCFADIADHLTIEPAASNGVDLSGPFAGDLRDDGNNLVMQALTAFRAAWPQALDHNVKIRLTKNLPIASGIGGGSADAAATLRLLASISNAPPMAGEMAELAATLGSDVPVCLQSRSARMSGRGETIVPGPELPSAHLVLINPHLMAATPEVFADLTQRENQPLPDLPAKFANLRDLAEWLTQTRNDLEQTATRLVPQIAEITAALSSIETCVFARVSGSGATVFGLFETSAHASKAVTTLGKGFPGYWIADGQMLS